MLSQLGIRDIVLIDRLDLAFEAGLTVLTGETGAGKSILLDAFSLALGGRGDGSLVRAGQAQGQVTAVFDLAIDHPARQVARLHDLDADGDLILRRVQMADGRTRAFVNDQAVSAQALRAVASTLVEIHGQHDDRALVDPQTHRAMLDAFGGLTQPAQMVAAAHRRWREAVAARDRRRAEVEATRNEADFLRHAAEELAKLAPQSGEEAALAARRQEMMAAEKVARELAEAHQALSGTGSPIPELSSLMRRLERRAAMAPALVEPSVKALDAALVALDEAAATLDQAVRDSRFDPRELEQCEERLFALRAAARKFDRPVDDLPALAARFAADLAALDQGEEALVALEAAALVAETEFRKLAASLSDARSAAAERLDAAVGAELAPLKLERARFVTNLTRDEQVAGAHGYDTVEFWVQTNPGARPGPLLKVASGGELSRFMLALKVVLAEQGSAPTLVFDEIDTGVGGAVADAIGQRLARLAERVQVVSVTHAPQVAAKAARHFLISKQAVGADRVATRVAALDDQARAEELARMLAGATITDEARAAARRLLNSAMAGP